VSARSVALLLALAALLAALLAGCTWTVSSARKQRINDCLRRCEAQHASQAVPGSGADHQHDTFRDTRTPCERECHSLR
jgi:hypothetical protein